MRSSTLRTVLLTAFALAAVSACRPKYPKCDKNEHCKKGEFCIKGMCQQCRTDADCPVGSSCEAGRCEPVAGYCQGAEDCLDGQVCRNNRCSNCLSDNECPTNYECQSGRCVPPPAPVEAAGCFLPTVYFDFDESVLTAEATEQLNKAAACIKGQAKGTVRVEGHCDPRGTEEYNLALGDRRARSVTSHLERLGTSASRLRPVSKGELEATGTDEAGWARDRKVVLIWE